MILDQSGSLSGVTRHDYLPFGEELFAGTGGRTATQGYSTNDGVRQHFTSKERDIETGLDFFEARYYSSMQGRFASVDPFDIISETKATAETNPDKAKGSVHELSWPAAKLESLRLREKQSFKVCRSNRRACGTHWVGGGQEESV